MEFRPNDLPNMVEGETRQVTLNLAGAVGPNTISEFAATSPNLTTSLANADGNTASFFLTADRVGTHNVLVSGDLSSGETIKGYIRVKVTEAPCASSSDY